MDTASIVTEVCRLNPDWTRAQVLDIINNMVKLVLKRDLDSRVYIDPSTGELPFLATTSGTFQYTPAVSGVTFWRIRNVVVDLNAVSENLPLWDQSGLAIDVDSADYDKEFQQIKFAGRTYVLVPVVKTSESGSTAPYVTFRFDPGTTTQKYRFMGLESPAEILSEATAIPLDDNERYTFMIPAVQTVIDALSNGRYVEGMQYVEEKLVPKVTWGGEKDHDRIFCVNYGY